MESKKKNFARVRIIFLNQTNLLQICYVQIWFWAVTLAAESVIWAGIL